MNKPIFYLDIHTHSENQLSEIKSVRSLLTHETLSPNKISDKICSIGIHPWFITNENYLENIEIASQWAIEKNVIAIGETGLDKRKGVDLALQTTVFKNQIALSEALEKPLIIHCVKAWNELFAIHKELKPKMRWIIHGFMGSVDLARQLLNRGFGISLWYSFALNKRSVEVIQTIPAGNLYLETDSSNVDIRTIYHTVANNLNIDICSLCERIGTI